MSVDIANELSNPVHTLADLWKLSDRHDDSAPQLGVHGPITKKRKLTLHQRQEELARREGETLASIARSYAVDASMISRLEPQITEPDFLVLVWCASAISKVVLVLLMAVLLTLPP